MIRMNTWLIVAASALFAHSAAADTLWFGASHCHVSGYTDTNQVQYQLDATNIWTLNSTQGFVCPIQWPSSGAPLTIDTTEQVNVYYQDASTAHSVLCHLDSYKPNGQVFIGPSKSSCGTPGGCDLDPNPGATGSSYLQLLPVSAGFQTGFVTMNVSCTVPGPENGADTSIRGYNFSLASLP
jgi:hypothetical protein